MKSPSPALYQSSTVISILIVVNIVNFFPTEYRFFFSNRSNKFHPCTRLYVTRDINFGRETIAIYIPVQWNAISFSEIVKTIFSLIYRVCFILERGKKESVNVISIRFDSNHVWINLDRYPRLYGLKKTTFKRNIFFDIFLTIDPRFFFSFDLRKYRYTKDIYIGWKRDEPTLTTKFLENWFGTALKSYLWEPSVRNSVY